MKELLLIILLFSVLVQAQDGNNKNYKLVKDTLNPNSRSIIPSAYYADYGDSSFLYYDKPWKVKNSSVLELRNRDIKSEMSKGNKTLYSQYGADKEIVKKSKESDNGKDKSLLLKKNRKNYFLIVNRKKEGDNWERSYIEIFNEDEGDFKSANNQSDPGAFTVGTKNSNQELSRVHLTRKGIKSVLSCWQRVNLEYGRGLFWQASKKKYQEEVVNNYAMKEMDCTIINKRICDQVNKALSQIGNKNDSLMEKILKIEEKARTTCSDVSAYKKLGEYSKKNAQDFSKIKKDLSLEFGDAMKKFPSYLKKDQLVDLDHYGKYSTQVNNRLKKSSKKSEFDVDKIETIKEPLIGNIKYKVRARKLGSYRIAQMCYLYQGDLVSEKEQSASKKEGSQVSQD